MKGIHFFVCLIIGERAEGMNDRNKGGSIEFVSS